MSKTLKRIVVALITLLTILGISIKVSADDTVKTPVEVEKIFGRTYKNMPERNTSGTTGLLPQYYLGSSGRYVTLPESRNNLSTNSWTATINGNIVYCSLKHAYVRYGQFDDKTYFLDPNGITVQGNSTGPLGVGSTVVQEATVEAKKTLDNAKGYIERAYNNLKDKEAKNIHYNISYSSNLKKDMLGISVGEIKNVGDPEVPYEHWPSSIYGYGRILFSDKKGKY